MSESSLSEDVLNTPDQHKSERRQKKEKIRSKKKRKEDDE